MIIARRNDALRCQNSINCMKLHEANLSVDARLGVTRGATHVERACGEAGARICARSSHALARLRSRSCIVPDRVLVTRAWLLSAVPLLPARTNEQSGGEE